MIATDYMVANMLLYQEFTRHRRALYAVLQQTLASVPM